MSNSRLIPACAAIFCLLIVAFPNVAISGHVVFLHSESGSTAWTVSLGDGLAKGLGSDFPIKHEFLGGPGQSEDHFDQQYERLADKYAGKRPDAVVAGGRTAFAFMRKFRGVFGDAPVFYCAMERPGPDELAQCGECTGVPLQTDIRGTVDLIFAMRPDTRLVVGVMDGGRDSRKARKRLEAAMEPYMDRAQLIFPGFEPGDDAGLTMESLASVASSVPCAGVVLFLGFSEDHSGRGFDETEAVSLLASRSVGPVFVLTDGWLGSGVIGGLLAEGREHGKSVARLISRLQDGESVREMLPQPPPNRTVLDGTVLTRFGVRDWPETAILVNEPGRPEDAGGIIPSNLLAWVAGLTALAVLIVLVRRFTKR